MRHKIKLRPRPCRKITRRLWTVLAGDNEALAAGYSAELPMAIIDHGAPNKPTLQSGFVLRHKIGLRPWSCRKITRRLWTVPAGDNEALAAGYSADLPMAIIDHGAPNKPTLQSGFVLRHKIGLRPWSCRKITRRLWTVLAGDNEALAAGYSAELPMAIIDRGAPNKPTLQSGFVLRQKIKLRLRLRRKITRRLWTVLAGDNEALAAGYSAQLPMAIIDRGAPNKPTLPVSKHPPSEPSATACDPFGITPPHRGSGHTA